MNSVLLPPQRGNTDSPSKIKFETEFCSFSGYLCRKEKLEGHRYCLKHILEDKNSPFSQCNFLHPNKKHCLKAAPSLEQTGMLCYKHYRQDLTAKVKAMEPVVPSTLAEYCVTQLEKYKSETGSTHESFKDLNELRTVPTLTKRPVDVIDDLDYHDEATVESAWKRDIDSETESVGSDSGDQLKHAGIYTPEEVMSIMHDKLIMLKELYENQFERLKYEMTEERREYRMARRRENMAEMLPIGGQPRDSIEEILDYQEAKAMSLNNKRQKLSKTSRTFQTRTEPLSSKVSLGGPKSLSQKPKCSFNLTSFTKCGETRIPLSKFCIKHIMNDTTQVLFRTCGAKVDTQDEPPKDVFCETPIVPFFCMSTCVYHTNFSEPIFSIKKQSNLMTNGASATASNGKDVN